MVVLRAIYNEEMRLNDFPLNAGSNDVKKVSQVTEMDQKNVEQKLDLLMEWGLIGKIEEAGGGFTSVGLTEKGFDVVHNQEIVNRQQSIDKN